MLPAAMQLQQHPPQVWQQHQQQLLLLLGQHQQHV
jgi:hypothetical protein